MELSCGPLEDVTTSVLLCAAFTFGPQESFRWFGSSFGGESVAPEVGKLQVIDRKMGQLFLIAAFS